MTITCVEDLRAPARRRIPRMFYDYVDGGSWTEQTYCANESDFARIRLRQGVAVNLENRTLRTKKLGDDAAMPVSLAPTGNTGMVCADGEILAARAAEAFGVPFTLSTMSICCIADVARSVTRPFWFQLYMMRGRTFIESLIERAKRANCSALMLTLELQVPGQRHNVRKNGLTTPPKPTFANLVNLAKKPRWCAGMLHRTGSDHGVYGRSRTQDLNLSVLVPGSTQRQALIDRLIGRERRDQICPFGRHHRDNLYG